jgi:hypothetical protein
MEQFIIPTLIRMIIKNKAISELKGEIFPGEKKFTLSIAGHSRGNNELK